MTLHEAPWLSGCTDSISPVSSGNTPAVNELSIAAMRTPSVRSHNSRPLTRTYTMASHVSTTHVTTGWANKKACYAKFYVSIILDLDFYSDVRDLRD